MALTRSKDQKLIAGVCGGIAEFLGWDVTIVRILFVLGTIFSFGIGGIIAYIALAIIMPEDTV